MSAQEWNMLIYFGSIFYIGGIAFWLACTVGRRKKPADVPDWMPVSTAFNIWASQNPDPHKDGHLTLKIALTMLVTVTLWWLILIADLVCGIVLSARLLWRRDIHIVP